MGSCCAGDAPTPPNPYAVAGAQTGTNVATAVANQALNQVNQVTPDGSLTYSQTGSQSFIDPVSGASYAIPTSTATQTLSPMQNLIKYQSDYAKLNLATMANNQSQRISGLLSTNVDYSHLPAAGDPSQINNTPRAKLDFADAGQIQNTFGDAGEITRSYGPEDNYSADRQRVEGALFERLDPQLQRDNERLRSQLADQGIRYGSPAYNAAMADQSMRVNDARLGITAQAGQEQQRLNAMDAQLAAFQNSAQGQAYQQALGRGTFANEAQQQQYGQNLGRAQFYNAGAQQQLGQQQSVFNAMQAARGTANNELYAMRNQPINEISALMSGSQVNNPNFINAPSSQIPVTDVAGIMNKNYDQQANNYNSSQQATSALIGGILGAGANIYRSDKRTKKNIEKVGTVFSTNVDDKPGMGSIIGERKELPVYEYSYKDDPSGTRHVGPMAQDVERIDKKAVLHDREGTKYIDKRRMIGGILRAA